MASPTSPMPCAGSTCSATRAGRQDRPSATVPAATGAELAVRTVLVGSG